jgi:hypothetical protein
MLGLIELVCCEGKVMSDDAVTLMYNIVALIIKTFQNVTT